MRLRWQPSLRVVPPYYEDRVYIAAIASSFRAELAKLPFTPDAVIASFHGMPQKYLAAGDPYHCQCQKKCSFQQPAMKGSIWIGM